MIRKELVVKHEDGLQAQSAARIVKCAANYKSTLTIEHGSKSGNGRTLFGILTLGIKKDDVICFVAEGEDEQALISALTALNESNYE